MSTVMEVSPAIFSEIQAKAGESWIHQQIWPDSDIFAGWAIETFGCTRNTSYKVVVVWEWANERRWAFSEKSC